jgi:hypothetical protein
VNTDAEVDRLWRKGNLRWKLDDHQLRIYDPYREFEQRRMVEPKLGIHRVFQVDCGRQVGKTHGTGVIRTEDGLNPDFANETILVGANTEVALKELVIPTINTIIADAPEDIRPRFFTSRWGMRAGYHFPSTDAVMKLVGFENPDDLRGPGLRGATISEAGFVNKLAYAVNSVLLPMFSRRPKATLILESSAPKDANHPFDRIFKPDAEKRRAYVFMTIDDNTALPEEEKLALVEAARAINPDEADREYYGKRTRDRTRVLVPEFSTSQHVALQERPAHAVGIAAMDPGMRDLFFVGWGYWDAVRAKLVVERDWSGRNKSTGFVAELIKATELDLYGTAAELAYVDRRKGMDPREEMRRILRVLSGEEAPDQGSGLGLFPPTDANALCWWNGEEFARNPVLRVSDTDARLIGDLTYDQGIQCTATEKDDAEAALYALRNAFRDGKIEINPRCGDLVRHLESGRWNERRTDWERFHEGAEAELYGHFDGVAMLVYMWRMVQHLRHVDPFPPKYTDKRNPSTMHIPEDWKPRAEVSELEMWLQ